MPKISIICAVARNGAIGKDSKLLCHISEDLKRFKDLTMGHPVIMGRKTYESIGKNLPGRTNIIITRNKRYKARCCKIADSLEGAIEVAKVRDEKEIFIIGGGEIFKQAIDLSDKIYLTLLEKDFDGDTFFPDYSEFKKIVFSQDGIAGDLKYKFMDLEK